MKNLYVRVIRMVRSLLATIGVLGLLDRWATRSRAGVWVRSLLSIYDPVELLELDVPWWTFASADLVEGFLKTRPQARVFEWGSGASSIWLAKRAASVTSVEHDADWAKVMEPMVLDNNQILVVEPVLDEVGTGVRSSKPGFEGLDFTEYVAAIDNQPAGLDLIVIDGRAREACLDKALPKLAPGGLIVFDNVDRERYVRAIENSSIPVAVTWTRGLTPSLPYPTRTAVIARA